MVATVFLLFIASFQTFHGRRGHFHSKITPWLCYCCNAHTAPGVAKTLSMTRIKENVTTWGPHAHTVRSRVQPLPLCTEG